MEKIDKRCLLTGASGFVGRFIYHELASSYSSIVGLCHSQTCNNTFIPVDLRDTSAFQQYLDQYAPEIVIHSAALRHPDACERTPDLARDLHVTATSTAAEWARLHDAYFLYISTDYVFDGTRPPYTEKDPVSPLSVYGHTKADGERVAHAAPRCGILRIPLQYGYFSPGDDSFLLKALRQFTSPGDIYADAIQPRSPTLSDDVAVAIHRMCQTFYSGILHLSTPSHMTRYQMMLSIADVFGYDRDRVIPDTRVKTPVAPRPHDSRLDTSTYSALTWPACSTFEDGLLLCKKKMEDDDCTLHIL